MMHDFALTEHYVLLFDLPVAFSKDAVFAGRELPTRGTRRTIPRSVGPTGWRQGGSAVKASTLFSIIAVVANALLVAVLGVLYLYLYLYLYLVGETSGAVVAALGTWGVVGFGLVPALPRRVVTLAGPGGDLAATLSASAVTPASRLTHWSRLAVEIQGVSLPRSSLL